MTKKYNVAVLLPTRGRTDALSRSVYSVVDNAIEPDKIQVLLAFDRDDNIGLDYFNSQLKVDLEKRNINFVAIIFNRLGYINLHRYYNELAKHADADWMFMWNDDAYMNTHGWDKVVKKYNGQLRVLKVHTHNDHPYSIFPIVPAVWLDLLGYLTGHHMIDAWVSQIAYMTDLIEIVDINVTHDRHDLTGNNADATFKERVTLEGKPHDPVDFHHISNTQRRMVECEKLAQYMQTQGMSTAWWEGVKAGTQDPWEKLKDFDTNKQMVQFSMKVDPATRQVRYDPENTQ
jgi:hypothetical protein